MVTAYVDVLSTQSWISKNDCKAEVRLHRRWAWSQVLANNWHNVLQNTTIDEVSGLSTRLYTSLLRFSIPMLLCTFYFFWDPDIRHAIMWCENERKASELSRFPLNQMELRNFSEASSSFDIIPDKASEYQQSCQVLELFRSLIYYWNQKFRRSRGNMTSIINYCISSTRFSGTFE